MNAERLTTKSREVIKAAVDTAAQRGHATVETWHLLLALLDTGDSTAPALLRAVGANPADVRRQAVHAVDRLPAASGSSVAEPSLARELVNALNAAEAIARPFGDEYVSTEHLLAGLARTGGAVSDALKSVGATEDALVAAFPQIRGGNRRVTSADPEQQYQALDKYSVDLTRKAREGKVDPVIGRDSEIRRVIQVLSRRTKNNPVLIGEPGVGKTAIVEGLAQRIVAGDIPESLRDKRLVSLDLGAMVAGAQYRGQFEERLKSVLEEIQGSDGQIITFLDELHTVVGAGKGEGSMDAGNMLKPMLARGELRMVGATTLDEYRSNIEKDPALERRFQPVLVGEPTVEDTIGILRGLKERYEVHHGVRITDAALVASAALSDRYIADRFLPDKAIDLIDEAASRLRMEIDSRPVEVDEIERTVRRLEIEEMALEKEPDPASAERLERLRRELADRREELTALSERWRNEKQHIQAISETKERLESLRGEAERAERDADLGRAAELRYGKIPELETALTQATAELDGHPVQRRDAQGGGRLRRRGGGRVVVDRHPGRPLDGGRDGEAAPHGGVAERPRHRPARGRRRGVRRRTAGPRRCRRPGPPDRQLPLPRPDRCRQDRAGQGARRVPVRRRARDGAHRHERVRREALGGPARRRPARLRRLRAGRPAHRGGAPPAVLGDPAGRGGEGTPGRVRRAAPGARRRAADRWPRPYGRLPQRDPDPHVEPRHGGAQRSHHDRRAAARHRCWQPSDMHFKPEFLNRLDDIVVFHALDVAQLKSIVGIQLAAMGRRLVDRRLTLDVTDAAKEWLATNGFDPIYGARPLRRLVQSAIGDSLAKALLAGEIRDGDHVVVDTAADGLSVMAAVSTVTPA